MLNKKVYIISICLKKKKTREHEFHFKGFYEGLRIKKLVVIGGEFEPMEEYLIKAKIVEFSDGILVCECVKSKSIFNW